MYWTTGSQISYRVAVEWPPKATPAYPQVDGYFTKESEEIVDRIIAAKYESVASRRDPKMPFILRGVSDAKITEKEVKRIEY